MKKSISLFGLTFVIAGLYAQAPNWQINPNTYQYNMTVTAIANINCNELLDSNNQIAAFIGNELHGIANTSVNVNGSLQANLVVYSNTISGEKVDFKVYRASIDSVYSSIDTVIFQSDEVVGDPASPFSIRNNHQPENLFFNGGNVDENVAVGTAVGTFSTADRDGNQFFTYAFASGLGDSNNSSFTLSADELLINEIPDYEKRMQYSVRIQSSDDQGCGISKSFLIHVEDKNDLPSRIHLSDTSFDENLPINSTLAILEAVDDDSSSYTFALVPGTGDDDNASFTIIDDKFRSNDSLNFEKKSEYKIRIQVTDSGGGIFQQMFICTINDLNEAPLSMDQEFSISENAKSGYVIDTILISDVDNAQLHSFEKTGTISQLFEVDVATGIIRLRGELDFEKQSEYSFDVLVSDNGIPVLTDSTFIIIKVLDEIEANLPASDFISPNGDGKNDVWTIKNVELYSNYQLSIYSASGVVVFSRSSNYNNDFDGRYNGEDLPEGIYYYLLKNSNGTDVFKGVINLIR